MARRWLTVCLVIVSGMLAGCRCCPCLNHYANCIDDVSDSHVYFDHWYCPRKDISRAGKPDWCSPLNERLSHCCCEQGRWDRYDDCHLYPHSYPYSYPGHAMPEPQAWQPNPPTPTPIPATPAPTTLPPAPEPAHG